MAVIRAGFIAAGLWLLIFSTATVEPFLRILFGFVLILFGLLRMIRQFSQSSTSRPFTPSGNHQP